MQNRVTHFRKWVEEEISLHICKCFGKTSQYTYLPTKFLGSSLTKEFQQPLGAEFAFNFDRHILTKKMSDQELPPLSRCHPALKRENFSIIIWSIASLQSALEKEK